MNSNLKIIKNKYGEQMMHLCRTLFPSLLETKGLLSSLILEHFAPSKILYDDIIAHQKEEEFKNYIYSLIDVEKKEQIKNRNYKIKEYKEIILNKIKGK